MLNLRVDIPRVKREKSEQALLALARQIGDSKIQTDEAACLQYGHDESETARSQPDGVVIAESTQDVMACLRVCEEYEVPVTPRGAGSGRTGGSVAVAGGVVLAMERMNRIKHIAHDDFYVVCEPGVRTGDLHSWVEQLGLFYPPDPNSLEYCAIGGNVAENAGGPRAFKYGVTREYTLGCEVVLMGGTRMNVGKRTIKGVTGYDVMATLVGSEGTLGVFTELTLRLLGKPTHIATLLVLFRTVLECSEAIHQILLQGIVPRCLELLDEDALCALRLSNVSIDAQAGAMLLIELDGMHALDADIEQLGNVCTQAKALEVLAAQDASQQATLWSARRSLSRAIRQLANFKLSEDVVVPRSQIPKLLEACTRIREEEQVRMLAYGHAGDGNLHINFLWNQPEEIARVHHAIERCFHETLALGGTLSGEHGIGVLKAPYLSLEQSEELIALQKRIKIAFDPKWLLNPGKIFMPGSIGHTAC